MSDAGQKPGLFWKIQGMLRRKEAESIRDQVEELIERHEAPSEPGAPDGVASGLDAQERALLGNVLRLRGITAYDVMVPRADIMAIPESHTLTETIALIQTEGHSRYPAYRNGLDDIVGMVHIKDVLPYLLFDAKGRQLKTYPDKKIIRSICRPVLFVPPSMLAQDLLNRMQARRSHMAIVVDEYGGASGIVTLEDVLEEIVGDITDEFDDDQVDYKKMDDGSFAFEGRTSLKDFYKILEIEGEEFEQDKGDSETIGGFIVEQSGRILKNKESITKGNF